MRLVKRAGRRLADHIMRPYFADVAEAQRLDQGTQRLLSLKYRELLHGGLPLPSFEDVGLQVFSQADEDGILLYLFSLIGTTDRQAVEACVAQGIECNSANLIVNHGWKGLLFDGSEANLTAGRDFYARCPTTLLWPPELVRAWVEAENVNALISGHGVGGEVDLLSVDVDGMDYWVWKAVDCIRPRVVVIEYQPAWTADRSVVVPYKRDFDRFDRVPEYWGASLSALVGLASEKGYRLVGSNRYGFNAFFLRAGVGEGIFPAVAASSCLAHPYARHAQRVWLPKIASMEWQEV